MQYRRLGNAGMKVSALAFGGWINFGEGKVPGDEAKRMVEAAYHYGIRYFDLADVYGNNEAEKQMGAVLKQYPRNTLVVASKVFWPMSDDPNDQGLSRKHIMESIDRSLKSLGMDYVDIYFCHRPDPETPIVETARAMDDLIHQGKVLYWGTSEWSGGQIREACAICEKYNLTPPQVEQPNYSMLKRDRVDGDVAPAARENGIGIVAFSPLAQGMLTGKYDNGLPEDSRFAREDWAKREWLNDKNVQRVKALKAVADDLGVSRTQLALAWVLTRTAVSSAITGATKVEQLEESVKAVDVKLSPEALKRIDQILTA